jgi:hypothetical protein
MSTLTERITAADEKVMSAKEELVTNIIAVSRETVDADTSMTLLQLAEQVGEIRATGVHIGDSDEPVIVTDSVSASTQQVFLSPIETILYEDEAEAFLET